MSLQVNFMSWVYGDY